MRSSLFLAAGLLLAAAASAEAHAILVESTPASNAVQPAGALILRLRYNSRIDPARSRLTLVAPDGAQSALPLDPGQSPDVLAAHVTLNAGSWRVRWQVLAVDGHITRGDVPFALTAP